jgi:hypothetical protein
MYYTIPLAESSDAVLTLALVLPKKAALWCRNPQSHNLILVLGQCEGVEHFHEIRKIALERKLTLTLKK